MYERFYNLRERPFALSPDPEYLYLSRVHREALDSIRYGVESRAGFIVVTGEIGAGKTTLLQTLLRRLDERSVVARIVNTTLEPRELLEAILLDFGLETAGKSKPVLIRDLGQFLVAQRTQGRRPLLVVDEAQNLSAPALEEVRLLSNLETEKSKLLQILLVGQPNLRDTIASRELEQFRQRIAVSYHLMPLDAPDTAAYINYRLEHAANGQPPRFSADAAALVHQRSGGVPRMINVICDAALVFGYAEERRAIDLGLLQDVVRELEVTGIIPSSTDSDAVHSGERAAPAAVPAAPSPTAAPPSAGAVTPAALAEADLRRERQLAAVHEAELARQRELVSRRESELAAREETLLQRERQIAEQRRIMSEEYRLLRQRQLQPSHTADRSMTAPAAGRNRGAERPKESRAVPFWQRLSRLFAREPAL